jgi:hypothetical protein
MTDQSPETTTLNQEAAPNSPRDSSAAGVADMVGKLDNPYQKQEFALAALTALPKDATAGVVARAVGKLDTTDEQKETALAALGALPKGSTPDVVAKMVGQLDTPDQQQATALAALNALSADGRKQVATTILGTPDRKTQRTLWYIVIGTIAAAIFVFGVLTFVLILMGKNAEAPLALATTALGGMVGLVATTPASH